MSKTGVLDFLLVLVVLPVNRFSFPDWSAGKSSFGNASEVGVSWKSSSFEIKDLNWSLTPSYSILILFNSLVVGSFSFLNMQSNKWAVFIEVLWKSLASRKVVFKALSACLVKCRFFLSLLLDSVCGFAGLNISTFLRKWFKSISKVFKIETALPFPSRSNPNIKCSVPINSCPKRKASSLLKAITSFTLGEKLSSIFIFLI